MKKRTVVIKKVISRQAIVIFVVMLFAGVLPAQEGASGETGSSAMMLAQAAYILPELSITDYASPSPVYEGADLTYTITVATANPLDATGVRVTDTLPAGVTYVSSSPVSCRVRVVNRIYDCPIGDIAGGGAYKTLTIMVHVNPGSPSPLRNSVQALPQEYIGTDATIPSVTTDTRLLRSPNVSIIKDASPEPVLLQADLTYTIRVVNSGLGQATGVRVTDRLPPEVRYVRSSKSDGTECSHSYSESERTTTVTCDLGTLAAGGGSELITIVTKPITTGTINNVASLIINEPNINPDPLGNQSNIKSSTAIPAADLAIIKGPSAGHVGVDLTYNISVFNVGPSDATGVTVTDTLPSGVDFVSADSRCGRPDSMRKVTCTIGAMARLSALRFPIVVMPRTAGEIVNVASVRGDQADPIISSNTFTLRTTIYSAADLVLTKTADQTRVRYATNLTYTITVRNAGPSTANNVQVTEPMPTAGRSAGTAFVSATPSQGNCPPPPARGDTTGTIICNLGDLAGGASATVTVVVTPFYTMPTPAPLGFVPPDTVVENTASVHADTFDPNSANNAATLRVTATAGTTIPFRPPSRVPGPRPIPAPL